MCSELWGVGFINVRVSITQVPFKHQFFAKIVLGYKPLTYFVKSSTLDVWLFP